MSLLDKIKKLFAEETPQLEKSEKKEIPFEQISARLEDKTRESSKRIQGLKQEIDRRITEFSKEIENSIELLEKVDLSRRKEHEKVKIIVRENLNLYISYLRRLVSNLEDSVNYEIQEHIQKIFSLLNEFNKSSHIPYEKATILIGRELAETKEKVRLFFKDINQLLNDNKVAFEEQKLINKIKNLFDELEKNNASYEEVEEILKNTGSELDKMKEEHKNAEEKIVNIKQSESYRKDMQEKDEYARKVSELDRNIHAIKEKIDLKALAKQFHSDKKQLQLIKDYSANFKSALEADSGLELAKLVSYKQQAEADSLKTLRDSILELKDPLVTNSEKEISDLEDKLKNLLYKISNLEENIKDESKKKEKFTIKKEAIIKDINELSKSLFN